jgi:hypothetical protein
MARAMINEINIAKHFWAETVNIACYIQNRISIRLILNKTPYEFSKNSKPNISYFHPFGCTCYCSILKNILISLIQKLKNISCQDILNDLKVTEYITLKQKEAKLNLLEQDPILDKNLGISIYYKTHIN